MTLTDAELYETADLFGVDLDQVRRDHVISHVLAAISSECRDSFLFIGGTMLSRTWLTDVRLSEDIDLIARRPRAAAGAELAAALATEMAGDFGGLVWDKDPPRARDAEPIFLNVGDDVTIKFQLLDSTGRGAWPSELRAIHQRYSGAPPAQLHVPSGAASVAMKLTAWVDRRAARDLYDLYAMAQRGMISVEATRLYAAHGQSTRPFQRHIFENPPSDTQWEDELGHQCRLTVTAAEAIAAVGTTLEGIGAISSS